MNSEMTSEGQQAGEKPTGDRMTVKQVVEYVRLYEEAIKKAAPTAWHRITLLFDKLKELEKELGRNVMQDEVESAVSEDSSCVCERCGAQGCVSKVMIAVGGEVTTKWFCPSCCQQMAGMDEVGKKWWCPGCKGYPDPTDVTSDKRCVRCKAYVISVFLMPESSVPKSKLAQSLQIGQHVLVGGVKSVVVQISKFRDTFTFLTETGQRVLRAEELEGRVDPKEWLEKEDDGG